MARSGKIGGLRGYARIARLACAAFAIPAMVLVQPAVAAGAQEPAQATNKAPTMPVAIGASLKADAHKARISFTLSRAVPAHAFLLERPDRVVIDLPEVNFQLPAGAGRKGEGVVASFRGGLFAMGRSRIIIDLKHPALVEKVETETTSGHLPRLVIELARTDRTSYRKAALKSALTADAVPDEQAAATTASIKPPGDKRPVIVLDPGHGGLDDGAVNAKGVEEKDIVFAFAQKLKERLAATGLYHVVMTRDSDTFISLGDRVKRARAAHAALFISIHADILRQNHSVRGTTVYTGSEFASDIESAVLAENENRADAAAGIESHDDPQEVADILTDLTKRETRAFSNRFATRVIGQISKVMKLNKNPHRSAAFRVLKAPDVPSVLLELGYLSSSKDASLLESDDWRDRMTASLVKAIDQYFAAGHVGKIEDAAVSP